MPHRLRKTRKMRGSRTVGYGRIGQHRDRGSSGYKKVGRHKHLWSYVVKYCPDYFGKTGFTSPQSLRREVNILNLSRLEELSNQLPVQAKKGTSINLTDMGYTKLLGEGKISKPIIVTVPACSKSASEKIEKAGGEVITEETEAEEPEE